MVLLDVLVCIIAEVLPMYPGFCYLCSRSVPTPALSRLAGEGVRRDPNLGWNLLGITYRLARESGNLPTQPAPTA